MTKKSPRLPRARRNAGEPPGRTRNELRIIAGKWRGRRIQFPEVAAIRPTPDRVRETLFNWLQHDIAGSRCLDLFAGSGALGLEALSRGARQVLFVDRERAAIGRLRDTLTMLGAQEAELLALDARRYLEGPAQPFDVVFLDPPFTNADLPQICAALEARGWLSARAYVYIEQPSKAGAPTLPANWTLLQVRAGRESVSSGTAGR
jgi:16S rRNA (guanine966-N2)-methyltransferase